MRLARSIYTLSLIALLGAAPQAIAADAKTEEPPLTPEELAETAHRKKCKIKICDAFLNKKLEGEDIKCDVVKTLRKAKIEEKYLRGKLSWPFGNAQCSADVSLKREMLVKAVTEAEYETALDKHAISCNLFKQDSADKYEMTFTIAPVVKWKGGKAEGVTLNIADIGGAALAKGGIWTIAKANSYFISN
jgi:hypothetical protein